MPWCGEAGCKVGFLRCLACLHSASASHTHPVSAKHHCGSSLSPHCRSATDNGTLKCGYLDAVFSLFLACGGPLNVSALTATHHCGSSLLPHFHSPTDHGTRRCDALKLSLRTCTIDVDCCSFKLPWPFYPMQKFPSTCDEARASKPVVEEGVVLFRIVS